ncbi:phospholipase C [Silvimonas iriomotensis]|uniref:Phospholipase C n=1 Tax=Silvimonas iriomotensis TaxID=449662 RepID=A0ABQ2P3U4_9NEIS|nr:alkaline phosphatase family protein [Silvimonas iriomotensis]GGP17623.1 hypothetical protein GCM10010970_00660 [Silvimonas iriomotensis]
MFQISVVNGSKTLSDRDIQRAIRAINRQIAEDFEPFWAFGGRLRLDASGLDGRDARALAQLRGDAILYVLDSARGGGFLGYHDHSATGVPFGYVFLDLCRELGDEWTTTLSHEALELIADPQCNLLVQGPHPANPQSVVYHYFEMCDAVQTVTYVLDGVTVSDFVLPAYFANSDPSARTSFCSAPLASFGVTPGGYIGFFDPGLNAPDTFFANNQTAARRLAVKRKHGFGRVAQRGAMAAPASTTPDPIEHVVVLMMENRSFDHMLGDLGKLIPGLDGVAPASPGRNTDSVSGKVYTQLNNASDTVGTDGKFVPAHEFVDVQQQISDQMGHFVDNYRAGPGKALPPDELDTHLQQVMSYFKAGELPVLHTLAQHFMVCDRWFSSLPGPTWPNRFFVHSGTCLGELLMPSLSSPLTWPSLLKNYNQDTLYDRLSDAQPPISWKIYHDGFPQTALLGKVRARDWQQAYGTMADFTAACAGKAADFPAYAFIEPRYFDNGNGTENDQHPSAGVQQGEQLIAAVYNAIRNNDELWSSTLLIITWDEHGGFYDHVVPPATVGPDTALSTSPPFDFTRLGVRVPAVLVSPWVPPGVDHTVYDHTSILRYACRKWNLPLLGNRMNPAVADNKVCGNFAGLMSLPQARTDKLLLTPAKIPAPAPTVWDDARESMLKTAEMILRPVTHGLLGAAAPGAVAEPALTVEQRVAQVDQWLAQKGATTPGRAPAAKGRKPPKAG